MLSCANSEYSKMPEVQSRRALLLAILFSVFLCTIRCNRWSTTTLEVMLNSELAKVKLTFDSVHTALYQRVSIAALAGKDVTHKISCGQKLSGNSLVAYRRHCSHCRYRRANLRSSLPSMVNFLTSDLLNTTKAWEPNSAAAFCGRPH